MKKILSFWLAVSVLPMMLAGCGEEPKTAEVIRPIKAMQIGGVENFGERWFPGKAKAAREANLAFRVAGTMASFPVNVGDEVAKGTLLARLDPRDFEVELENAEAQLRKIEAALNLAQTEFTRVETIWRQDPGAVSQSMVDTRRGQLKSAKAQLNSAQTAVERARDNLGYTALMAPFTGTVVEKFVENFEDVNAKEPIVRLVDTAQIEFTIQLPESLMVHAVKVNKAIVVFDAQPDVEIVAEIKEIGKEASQATRTYPVTLIMDQPSQFDILPGMAGKARGDRETINRIARRELAESVEIPVAAVFSDQGDSSFVWVVDNDTQQVHRRQVAVGELTDNGVLVEGIRSGEWIATAGVNTLVEGQIIRILKN